MKYSLILKNSLFYTLASVLQGMISFLLLPLYTRYLTPTDYAMLALVNSFIGIVAVVITLQIQTGIPRFVIKFLKDQDRAKKYFSSIFILLSIIVIFGCLAINLFGEIIIKVAFSDKNNITYSPLFKIATWTLLFNLLVSSGMLLLQALEFGDKFLLVTIAQVMANLIFGLFFVVLLKIGIIGVLWAQFISAIFGLVVIVWFLRDWFKWVIIKFPINDIKDSLRYSMPIMPHILGIYVYMYSDRLILQRYVPLADIGIYSIADTFASLLLIVVNSTTGAYTPRFFKLAEEGKTIVQSETKKVIGAWWIGIIVIFMGYLILPNYIVKLMTRPSFYPAIPVIPILASAYVFRGLYCFATNGLFFINKTQFIPVITISAAVLNIILNLTFIPKFGIYAAAWTTVISYFLTFILSYYFSQKFYPIIYPWKQIIKSLGLVALFYVITMAININLSLKLWPGFILNFILIILFGIFISLRVYKTNLVNFLKFSLTEFTPFLKVRWHNF